MFFSVGSHPPFWDFTACVDILNVCHKSCWIVKLMNDLIHFLLAMFLSLNAASVVFSSFTKNVVSISHFIQIHHKTDTHLVSDLFHWINKEKIDTETVYSMLS